MVRLRGSCGDEGNGVSAVVRLRGSCGEEGNGGEVEADSVLEPTGLTSVTSSMPSSKYTTSCIVS